MQPLTIPHHRASLLRRRPLTAMLCGALGDLSLTRIVPALSDYTNRAADLPLHDIVLCDLIDPDPHALAATIARRAIGHRDAYFTPAMCAAIEADGALSDAARALIDGGQSDRWLTPLGRFVVEHYRQIAADDFADLDHDPAADLLCYVATPPRSYAGICEGIARARSVASRTVIVLEKPFAPSADEARALRERLHRLEQANANLAVFGAEHYFAKPVVRAFEWLMRNDPATRRTVRNARCIEVRLLEAQPVPPHRQAFMSSVGLFGDMGPHLLALLQIAFTDTLASVAAAELRGVGSYPGYQAEIRALPDPGARHAETWFELALDVRRLSGRVRVILESGKRREDRKVLMLDGQLALDVGNRAFGPALDVPDGLRAALAGELDGYPRLLHDAVQLFRLEPSRLRLDAGLPLHDLATAARVATHLDALRRACDYPLPGTLLETGA